MSAPQWVDADEVVAQRRRVCDRAPLGTRRLCKLPNDDTNCNRCHRTGVRATHKQSFSGLHLGLSAPSCAHTTRRRQCGNCSSTDQDQGRGPLDQRGRGLPCAPGATGGGAHRACRAHECGGTGSIAQSFIDRVLSEAPQPSAASAGDAKAKRRRPPSSRRAGNSNSTSSKRPHTSGLRARPRPAPPPPAAQPPAAPKHAPMKVDCGAQHGDDSAAILAQAVLAQVV